MARPGTRVRAIRLFRGSDQSDESDESDRSDRLILRKFAENNLFFHRKITKFAP